MPGGVLRGKMDRGDRRKSYKINLKNTNKLEFIKEVYSKYLFLYPNEYQFYLFRRFCLNNPKKY